MPPQPLAPEENDLPFEESVDVLVSSLPAPVRAYVTGKEPGELVMELTRKYQLHVDQATELHQGLLMMLLGVSSPDQFARHLEQKAFSQDAVKGILGDLNDRVFVPLRKAERGTEEKPAAAPERRPLAPIPAPLGAPLPPAPAPMPVPTRAPQSIMPPPEAMPAPLPATEQAPIVREAPVMRTMAHDVETLGQPAPLPTRAPIPVPPPTSAPSPEAPSAWATPVPAPVAETPPPHPMRAMGAPDPKEITSTLQKYGIDPYREPIE